MERSGGGGVSCEDLVCAACAGQVVNAGCPVCREARAHVHHGGLTGAQITAVLLAVLTVVVLLARLPG